MGLSAANPTTPEASHATSRQSRRCDASQRPHSGAGGVERALARLKRADPAVPIFGEPVLVLAHPVLPSHRRECVLARRCGAELSVRKGETREHGAVRRVLKMLHARLEEYAEAKI